MSRIAADSERGLNLLEESMADMTPPKPFADRKPTPGNWKRHGPRLIVSDCSCKHWICNRLEPGGYGGRHGVATVSNEADAPLIAAAKKTAALVEELRKVCEEAAELYDLLALSSLEAAAKYGPDYEPPTDADCLAVREALQAVIAKAKELT